MKTVNVKAYSVNDVKKVVPFSLSANGANCTIAWKKAGSPIAGDELKAFLLEQLKKKTKNVPGLGCYIVLDAAVSDSRENPYKILNIPTTQKRKMKKIYELVNVETEQVLGTADSKEDAITLAKTLVTSMKETLGVGVKHECRIKKVVTEGEATAFTFEYTPSQNAKQGTFLCFGIETETI